MNIKRYAICYLMASMFLFSNSTFASEIGFTSGFFSSYSGSAEIFTNQSSSLKNAGIPISFFVLLDNIKISYLHYKQQASDEYSSGSISGRGSILVENDVISLSYYKSISETDGLKTYASGGIGLFQSIYNAQAYLYTSSDSAAISTNVRSANMFDIGFLLSIGAKKLINNAFIGAEINYINKTMIYEKNAGYTSDPGDIDIGGLLFSLTTGMMF